MKEESDALIARNEEIDRQLACKPSAMPCESNEECCSGSCGVMESVTLGDLQVCQPAN